MDTKEKINKKTCTFFASDYHFEMISLPYINKKIENREDVVILTENNLEETVKILVEKTNLKEENRNKILEIDWKNDDLNKFKKIKNNVKNNKKTVVFVKGKENYIKNINRNIEKWNLDNKINIIDCYDIEEIGDKMKTIIDKYECILNTKGEKEI